jgi:hypothetical protein
VLHNVLNVLVLKITVSLVMPIDSKNQFVTVMSQVGMMICQTKFHVNLVMKNVILASASQIVYNVLLIDTCHQSVHLSQLTLNLLKLLISQLVLLLLLLVKPNVLNVLLPQDIVNNVMLTDMKPLSVHVLDLDIMKTLKSV